MVELIYEKYAGNIRLHEPFECKDIDLEESLKNILAISNGIEETMIHPKTNETMAIAWIVYSYDEMCRETLFYKENYGINGTVFSDDGAGNPYYLFEGKVYQFVVIDGESEFVAETLEIFFNK